MGRGGVGRGPFGWEEEGWKEAEASLLLLTCLCLCLLSSAPLSFSLSEKKEMPAYICFGRKEKGRRASLTLMRGEGDLPGKEGKASPLLSTTS